MEQQSPERKPIILQKPPGYRDPATPQKHPLPRKPPLPPSFRPKPKKRHYCRICCCTFCILLIFFILIFILFIALFYILYQPSLPEIHLGSFRIPDFKITKNADGGQLDADTIMVVDIKNRNTKIAWHFDQSSVHIWGDNGDLKLGSTKVAAFDVKVQDISKMKVHTKVRDEVLDGRQKRRLKSVFESKALQPSVEVKTRTGVKVQGWKSMTIGVTVVCSGVTVRQIQNGNSPLCSFTIFQWIKIK
ncbi:NDR1/HIN1-like protein 13 [Lathyrus oleraceus]|uniref:Late embryogenesis abundant protein LEA-2 subgroup domain-containing protein n=1 Tax=Pisum sativum TaxID=3888 RepID=A0A9D4XRQ3_PEA|nr:NDR1/HIN1-like protein 13 [Pisum sativum]KAI5423865.1 hypothetical protein KIW84_030185 [Pisum sativum]